MQRVLLVGGDRFDTVCDSYRRALQGHYEVKVIDPSAQASRLARRISTPFAARIERGLALLSQVAFGEPLALAEKQLIRAAAEFAPDIVVVGCIADLRPQIVAALRGGNARCRVIGVYSDHLANFGRGYFFGADYDRLFFKDHYIVDTMRAKLGWTHVHYLPQACDRVLHHGVELTDEDRAKYGCDLTVAGNPYLFRAECLRPLVGRDLKVWGTPPPRWFDHPTRPHFLGKYVAGEEKCKAMLAAKIVINQNHYAEIAGTNKRTFEVAAIGAFQLTDTPALRDVFDPEIEVASFDTQRDLLEKIDYYLGQPEKRAAMGAAAARRAHAEHTYEHRWVATLETLGLQPPPGFPVQPGDLAQRAR